MLSTYKAILQNDHLRWLEDAPVLPATGEGVTVLVTVSEQLAAPPPTTNQQDILAILNQLAERRALAEIENPVTWQQELRADRELPGRE